MPWAQLFLRHYHHHWGFHFNINIETFISYIIAVVVWDVGSTISVFSVKIKFYQNPLFLHIFHVPSNEEEGSSRRKDPRPREKRQHTTHTRHPAPAGPCAGRHPTLSNPNPTPHAATPDDTHTTTTTPQRSGRGRMRGRRPGAPEEGMRHEAFVGMRVCECGGRVWWAPHREKQVAREISAQPAPNKNGEARGPPEEDRGVVGGSGALPTTTEEEREEKG